MLLHYSRIFKLLSTMCVINPVTEGRSAVCVLGNCLMNITVRYSYYSARVMNFHKIA